MTCGRTLLSRHSFYDRLDLRTARKPRLIVGGRGCGKSMLLRYLSHQTMFSRLRPSIPDDAIDHIGLYWRADTHFVNMMTRRGLSEDTWHSAFAHTAALVLGMEVLASLSSIAESKVEILQSADVRALRFERLGAFDENLPTTVPELYKDLEARLWELQAWVNDV